MPEDERPPAPDHLRILAEGEIEVVGRLPWSSNGTFLVTCVQEGVELPAVYKPLRGERPLWDFPPGIYRREVAAWVLSEALGWGLVPATVEREDCPLGVGSLQRFVPADFSEHYFTLVEDTGTHEAFRTLCAFDVVANNTDRKSGHCLLGEDGSIWAIDHGLCFHEDPKLRTVIWEFAGEPLGDGLCRDLARLAARPPDAFDGLLSPAEIRALARRADRLAADGSLPAPGDDRHHYPWPLV